MAELLLREGGEVIGAARAGWHDNAPSSLVDSAKLLQWDICDPANQTVIDRLRDYQPDVVFHFAAISIPALCGSDQPTPQALSVNFNGTRNLLDLVEKLPNSPTVIFSSTSHVYGRVTRENAKVTEDSALSPVSAYGQTKLKCEQEIRRRVESESIKGIIARGFHHIGPRQPSGLMLTDWLDQLADKNITQINVRSTNSHLDLVDVRDATQAYQLLATSGKNGETYNLGSGRIANSGDVLRVILSMADRKLKVVAGSEEERWNAIADVSKLNSLGWSPRIEPPQTIGDMLRMANLL